MKIGLSGRFDYRDIPVFERITRNMPASCNRLFIDLSQVQYMDHSAVQALESIHDQLHTRMQLVLMANKQGIRIALQIHGLDSKFRLCDSTDIEECLAAA